jgi:hypothetical protein
MYADLGLPPLTEADWSTLLDWVCDGGGVVRFYDSPRVTLQHWFAIVDYLGLVKLERALTVDCAARGRVRERRCEDVVQNFVALVFVAVFALSVILIVWASRWHIFKLTNLQEVEILMCCRDYPDACLVQTRPAVQPDAFAERLRAGLNCCAEHMAACPNIYLPVQSQGFLFDLYPVNVFK